MGELSPLPSVALDEAERGIRVGELGLLSLVALDEAKRGVCMRELNPLPSIVHLTKLRGESE